MTVMEAYLDDFGSVTVLLSRRFYNGRTDGFYLTAPRGYCKDCLIRGVEERESDIKYALTIPAEFEFGIPYVLHESHGQAVPLKLRFIVRTRQFDRLFSYEGDDLGCTYHHQQSQFALWAPTATAVSLRITDGPQTTLYAMTRTQQGVWRAKAAGDLRHAVYSYLVQRNGEIVKCLDPYALSSTANGEESAVIDPALIMAIPDTPVTRHLTSSVDAVVYECSVRDMTSSRQTGTSTNGRFLSLCETGTAWKNHPTGLDYLCRLGITHVQLMPVTDFATVDEQHPQRGYNWGYDPLQLLSLEGSYASDPDDPYARMKEFRQLVTALHARGIRVNLDLVLNHVYDVSRSAYDGSVPFYYFRYNDSGYLSNGSFCGNDMDSQRPMVRRYFLHVIRTLMQLYGVDGFRFDLMGILDIDTVNAIVAAARSSKPDAMIYGEGWNMPTCLDDRQKATIENQHRLPGVGFFNDYFRDIVKGKTSDDQRYERGYITGNLNMSFDLCSALAGNVLGDPYYRRFDAAEQSINALETHDNLTMWDKMHACCGDENREVRRQRQKMMIACTLLAQGVPFLHAGEEFCGTKKDHSNSYNEGDDINGMNWDRMVMNDDIVEYTRQCIALRQKHASFRLNQASQLAQHVHFSIAEGGIVIYDISGVEEASGIAAVRVIVNPSADPREYRFEENWQVILDQTGQAHSEMGPQVQVPAYAVIVCARRQ